MCDETGATMNPEVLAFTWARRGVLKRCKFRGSG
jgi:hypothetical protein